MYLAARKQKIVFLPLGIRRMKAPKANKRAMILAVNTARGYMKITMSVKMDGQEMNSLCSLR